jgi:hypothetical protein
MALRDGFNPNDNPVHRPKQASADLIDLYDGIAAPDLIDKLDRADLQLILTRATSPLVVIADELLARRHPDDNSQPHHPPIAP